MGEATLAQGAAPVPFVTVVMPVRDEADFIERGVRAVLDQEYPHDRLEVLVSEGCSRDGTRAIVESLAKQDDRLQLIDNPEGIVPTGLNRAIRAATGEIIIRVDGHCDIDPTFVRESVNALADHEEAWAVGGPIAHRGRSAFGKAAAYAMSSPAGVGSASHRFEGYEGYSDSVAFPAFRRAVFDDVGDFDPALVRNQDDELNFRIIQAGGKIFVTPRIGYRYYVREKPSQLFRQYYQYAFWRLPMLRKHGRPTTIRQLVPPLFFLAVGTAGIAGAIVRRPMVGVTLPVAYVAALSVVGARSLGELSPDAATRVPLALAILHTGYASGWAMGVWSVLFRRHAWDTAGTMAESSR